MKHIILFIAAALIFNYAEAQKLKASEVPTAIQMAFSKSFHGAKDVKWSKEGDTEFEVEYKIGSTEQATNYDKDGKWLVTETEIKKSDLPAAVVATLNKDFAGYDLEEIERVDAADQGNFFELEVEKGKSTYEVKIAADGNVIGKTEKKKGKNDKD